MRACACASTFAPETDAAPLALGSSAEMPLRQRRCFGRSTLSPTSKAGIRDCLNTDCVASSAAASSAAASSAAASSTDGSAAGGCSTGGSLAPFGRRMNAADAAEGAADTDAGAMRGKLIATRGGGRGANSSSCPSFGFGFSFGSAHGVTDVSFGLARRCRRMRRRSHHPPPQAHIAHTKSATKPSTATSIGLASSRKKAATPSPDELAKEGPCGASGGGGARGGKSGGSKGGGDEGGRGGLRGGRAGGALGGRSGGGGGLGGRGG